MNKPPTGKELLKLEEQVWREAIKRSIDGIGTEGTRVRQGLFTFRYFAVLLQIAGICYLTWRAARTFVPGRSYPYSIVFFVFEYVSYCFSFAFLLSLWYQIERPPRWAGDMLPKGKLPHVDVYIVRHTEPVDVLEPTVIAALNMNWPGEKLTVHVLDDGASKDVLTMVRNLRRQMMNMKRAARLVYVSREHIHAVPHHAKAGNINHAILGSQGKGEYILVLDTDMIVHPDFLQRTIGHFYTRGPYEKGWVQKERCAFLQTPQGFWNVPDSDPMVHSARFFYGPMLQVSL